jgi:tRNA-splicing ligase RtcB
MQYINDKLSNWASIIDPNAIVQAERTARLPIVDRVALMADAHVGLGATVGSVIGTKNAIIPAAVGVDIGCGMIAHQLDMTADDLPDNLGAFMSDVERVMPAGVGKGHNGRYSRAGSDWLTAWTPRFSTKLDQKQNAKVLDQFGTLGSGNHFFEICLDQDNCVWFVVHSGSRGIGNQLAQKHIKAAKKLCADKGIGLEDKDLAYLTEADTDFYLYMDDLLACQDYARANREQMMHRVVIAFRAFIGRKVGIGQTINCHHNYTEREVHNGEELWVTRKGAIKADVGDYGVIPGSMGTRSYIVKGLGNADSYCSCSHGAGRVHSRGAAKRLYTADDLTTAMDGKVWNHNRAQSLVDEIPQAYKDVDQVMEDQKDLVEATHTLSQVFNYKG